VGDGASNSLNGAAVSWRGELLLFAIVLALMLWPLAINAAPFYSADSASYLRGGGFGFNTGLLIVDHWWQGLAGTASVAPAGAGDPKAIVATAIAESGGARSVIYSLVTFLLRFPANSLIALAAAQAATVVLATAIIRRLIAPEVGTGPSLAAGAALALLTSAPWYSAYAMPDILAGITIAGSVALTVLFDRATLLVRLTLVLLVAFAVTTHGSHLLIAFGTLVTGAAVNLWMCRGSPAGAVRKALWFASPMVLAVVALLGTSYVAFGEPSLAPKRYPIQLARSVSDGPGYWYLRDHCATERFAICEIYGTNPPRKVNDFLWGPNGVRYRATPEQMERIRAEESRIVRGAFMEHPTDQVVRSIRNSFAQLGEFGLRGLAFGFSMTMEEDPQLKQIGPDRPQLRAIGEWIIYGSFFASLPAIAILRRRLRRLEIAALSVAGIGLLANAVVCGTLSGVTDRYQGRVAWVLPALVLIILARLWQERRSTELRA
jgi:hypothetical protein